LAECPRVQRRRWGRHNNHRSGIWSNARLQHGRFSGALGTPTGWSDTSITVPVPNGARAGYNQLAVTVSGVASNATSYAVGVAIGGVSPGSAPAVGTSITITGVAFGATQGSSTVSFSGALGTPTRRRARACRRAAARQKWCANFRGGTEPARSLRDLALAARVCGAGAPNLPNSRWCPGVHDALAL
jgi:hypothetical protein